MQGMLLFTDSSSRTGCKWNAVEASQIVRAAIVEKPMREAPVEKEAAGNVVEASLIVGTARIAETPGATPVVKEAAKNAVDLRL